MIQNKHVCQFNNYEDARDEILFANTNDAAKEAFRSFLINKSTMPQCEICNDLSVVAVEYLAKKLKTIIS